MLSVPHKERLASFKCLEFICHQFFLKFCSLCILSFSQMGLESLLELLKRAEVIEALEW